MMNFCLSMEERSTSEINCYQIQYILLMLSGSFNGWGVTVFDSLDTMWIMGLRDLFQESLELVAKSTFTLDEVSHPAICIPP
jgi:mannosyl-oligosaccharide alpha-1,2-mannosidase